MPYYDTIEEDLARAKEILAKGKADVKEFHRYTGLTPELSERAMALCGGAIYGADIYAAYKLLESFVAEIERLTGAADDRP